MGKFTEHNKSVVADITSKTSLKEAVHCYVSHVVRDGNAVLDDPTLSTEDKLVALRAAGQALLDQFEPAWDAIRANTNHR